jgi:serine/threonine-protein kinase
MGAKSIDHRTDLWSLGVVAYFALTGVRPFDGETLGAISIAIVHQRPPAIRSFRPDLPAEIDDWFAKATAPAAADRFSTAKEMADALVALAGGPGNALVPARSTADAAHSRPKLSLAEASAPTLGKGDETALALARAPSAAGEDPPAPAQPSAATAGVAPSSPGPRRLMAIAALGVALLVGGVVLFMRRDGAGQDGNRSATNNVGVVASARVLGVEAPSASPGASIASPTTASPSAAASSASDPSSAASIDVGMRSGTSDAKPGQAGSSARPSIAGIAAPSTTSSNAGRPPTKPSAGRSASSATTPVSPRQHEEPLE